MLPTSTIPATTTTVVPSIVALQLSPSAQVAAGGFAEPYGNFFTPSRDIQITSLGVYDVGGDGFVTSKDVGIFNDFVGTGTTPNPNTPLVSVTIPAGSSPAGATFVADAGGVGGTWFLPITPITLVSGTKYPIVVCCFGGEDNGEDNAVFAARPAGFIIGQDLMFSGALSYAPESTSITDSNVGFGPNSGILFFGPNFQYK